MTQWEVWCDVMTATALHGALGKKEGESVRKGRSARSDQGCKEYKSENEGRGLGEFWREETMGLITRSPILYKNILITYIIYKTNSVIVFLITR